MLLSFSRIINRYLYFYRNVNHSFYLSLNNII